MKFTMALYNSWKITSEIFQTKFIVHAAKIHFDSHYSANIAKTHNKVKNESQLYYYSRHVSSNEPS